MADKLVSTKMSRKIRQSVVDQTGFEPDELLAAPVKPPTLKNVRPGPRPEQLLAVVSGFILTVLGLALLIVRLSFAGIVLTVIGVLAIVFATLVRI